MKKDKYNITKKFLIKEYSINEKSMYKIAEEIGCNYGVIQNRMVRFNIKRRTLSEAHPMFGKSPTKETREKISKANKGKNIGNKNAYIDGRTNKKYYCIEPGCNNEISYQNYKYGQGRCNFCASKGNHNGNWKDGRTPLGVMIRKLTNNKEWIKKIFKRDNYTCQQCGQYSGKLEVHHKIPFAELLSEFLIEYDQFSPIEDKETLIRLALKWKPFWDIDNGQTLCEDCHNRLHPSYNFNK